MQAIYFVIGIVAAWLPGWLTAKLLHSPLPLVSGAIVSAVLLFNAVFWLNVAAIRISYTSVCMLLCIISAILGVVAFRTGSAFSSVPDGECRTYQLTAPNMVLGTLFVITFLIKFIVAPLQGSDMKFRWEYLAEKILQTGTIRFYPPVSAADFHKYVYPDGFAPLVSITYWWMYASADQAIAALAVIPVAVQMLAIAVFIYRLSETQGGSEAANWSILLLMGSSLVWIQIQSGIECGWIALSLIATYYFLVMSRMEGSFHDAASKAGNLRSLLLAGIVACAGALSRDYGPIIGALGILYLAVERRPLRDCFVFVLPLMVLAAPWYIRNWIVTGNPVFSLSIARLFPVNPVYAGTLEAYAKKVSVFQMPFFEIIKMIIWIVVYENPLVFALGVFYLLSFKRHTWFFAASFGVFVLLWIKAIGCTASGWTHSVKVLTPVFVVLSVCGGVLLRSLPKHYARAKLMLTIVSVLLACKTLLDLISVPYRPFKLSLSNLRNMPASIRSIAPNSSADSDLFARKIAEIEAGAVGTKIITADLIHGAQLQGHSLTAISIFSPESQLLFNVNTDRATILDKLAALNVRFIEDPLDGGNDAYFLKFPFFTEILPTWEKLPITGARVYKVPEKDYLK
jgi:hypothetical protein